MRPYCARDAFFGDPAAIKVDPAAFLAEGHIGADPQQDRHEPCVGARHLGRYRAPRHRLYQGGRSRPSGRLADQLAVLSVRQRQSTRRNRVSCCLTAGGASARGRAPQFTRAPQRPMHIIPKPAAQGRQDRDVVQGDGRALPGRGTCQSAVEHLRPEDGHPGGSGGAALLCLRRRAVVGDDDIARCPRRRCAPVATMRASRGADRRLPCDPHRSCEGRAARRLDHRKTVWRWDSKRAGRWGGGGWGGGARAAGNSPSALREAAGASTGRWIVPNADMPNGWRHAGVVRSSAAVHRTAEGERSRSFPIEKLIRMSRTFADTVFRNGRIYTSKPRPALGGLRGGQGRPVHRGGRGARRRIADRRGDAQPSISAGGWRCLGSSTSAIASAMGGQADLYELRFSNADSVPGIAETLHKAASATAPAPGSSAASSATIC